MTNWQSPAVISSEAFAYVKLLHFLGGLYIWELVLNVDFYLAIFMRKSTFRRSFLLYLGAQCFPLIIIMMHFGLHDSNSKVNCGVYIASFIFFLYGGFLFASSLIVLRVVEIWERNKIVVGVSCAMWLINFGACIHSVAVIRGHSIESSEGAQSCLVLNITETKYNILFIIITNIVLLTLTLAGLLRWNNRQKGDIWHLLSVQGVPWIVLLTVATIPPLVLIYLNLNRVMDVIIQIPALIIISIAATRVYRGLPDYFGRTDHPHSTQVTPSGQLGRFVARRGTSYLAGSGVTQGSSQMFAMASLAPASDDSSGNSTMEKVKVTSGSHETV